MVDIIIIILNSLRQLQKAYNNILGRIIIDLSFIHCRHKSQSINSNKSSYYQYSRITGNVHERG